MSVLRKPIASPANAGRAAVAAPRARAAAVRCSRSAPTSSERGVSRRDHGFRAADHSADRSEHGPGASASAGSERSERSSASRAELLPHFLNSLEAELANAAGPAGRARPAADALSAAATRLALVNDQEIEETSALTDAATRAELQNSLPLFLLGQRFGVLAGRPAFDAETLPIGPQALCRSIRRAVERLELDVEVRLLFYRAFERQVMPLTTARWWKRSTPTWRATACCRTCSTCRCARAAPRRSRARPRRPRSATTA